MTHVVLLGDSVFDNKAYVGGGPDVSEQLRALVSADWKVSLLAQDGAVIASVVRQLESAPLDATHLVISTGGNDALGESGVLEAPARSVGEVLQTLADVQSRFRENYVRMLSAVATRKLPTAVCTIYDPRYPEALRRKLTGTALSILND